MFSKDFIQKEITMIANSTTPNKIGMKEYLKFMECAVDKFLNTLLGKDNLFDYWVEVSEPVIVKIGLQYGDVVDGNSIDKMEFIF